MGSSGLVQIQRIDSCNINILCHNVSVDCCVLFHFHTLLYLLNLFCAFFLPVPFITPCNIPYVCYDLLFDIFVVVFDCLNACDNSPVRHLSFTRHIHSYNRLLKRGVILFENKTISY